MEYESERIEKYSNFIYIFLCFIMFCGVLISMYNIVKPRLSFEEQDATFIPQLIYGKMQ